VAELSDSAIAESLRRHLTVAAARQVVAASNLANVDTPGYKAQEADFSATLQRRVTGAVDLATTQPGHLTSAGTLASQDGAAAVRTKDADESGAKRDGNTVQLDHELLNMTQAAGEFARAQTALAAKFRLLRYAINEGK
jgi:flagellar basal-body rod protein FlgB